MASGFAATPPRPPLGASEPAASTAAAPTVDFATLYKQHADFVFRGLRRLGVRDPALEDAVQDVFVVVHRQLPGFRGQSTLRTWLFGILLRVARQHRRAVARTATHEPLPETLVDADAPAPLDAVLRAEATRMLYAFLDGLDDDKREAFVLAEIEQVPVAEVAALVGAPVQTIYSRLKVARREFEQAAARLRAHDRWRERCTNSAPKRG